MYFRYYQFSALVRLFGSKHMVSMRTWNKFPPPFFTTAETFLRQNSQHCSESSKHNNLRTTKSYLWSFFDFPADKFRTLSWRYCHQATFSNFWHFQLKMGLSKLYNCDSVQLWIMPILCHSNYNYTNNMWFSEITMNFNNKMTNKATTTSAMHATQHWSILRPCKQGQNRNTTLLLILHRVCIS